MGLKKKKKQKTPQKPENLLSREQICTGRV